MMVIATDYSVLSIIIQLVVIQVTIPPYANQKIYVIGLNITMEMYGREHSINIMVDLRRHHINGWLHFSSMKKQAFQIVMTCSANKLKLVCRVQQHPSLISPMQC